VLLITSGTCLAEKCAQETAVSGSWILVARLDFSRSTVISLVFLIRVLALFHLIINVFLFLLWCVL